MSQLLKLQWMIISEKRNVPNKVLHIDVKCPIGTASTAKNTFAVHLGVTTAV